jgi:RNA polymerase sigma factor (sigma-70 family)
MNDLLIIKRVLNGHQDEFAIIMNKYSKELFHYIYNLTGNVQDTEDYLQDIFLKAFNQLQKYNSKKASFRTWIYRISHNHVMTMFRKSKPYSIEENKVDEIASYEDIEMNITEKETIEEIILAIKMTLKPKEQLVIQYDLFSTLTVEEISEVTGFPLKTVYRLLKQSKQKLQKVVKRDE